MCCSKGPGFGERRKAMMEDLAILTGGTVITEELDTTSKKQKWRKDTMKNEQTEVIKDMEFLLNELHKEWERPGEVKSSVSIPYEKVEEISRKLNVIVYETQQSADSDGLAFKQSIAKSKQCYVLLRIMRKIVKGKGKCDRQAVNAEFVIELDGEESKLFKEMFAELLK